MASNHIASNEGARHVARFTLKIGQGVTADEIRIIRIFFLLFLPYWVDSWRRDVCGQERPEVVNSPMLASQTSVICLYDEWWRQAVLPCLLTLEGQARLFPWRSTCFFSERKAQGNRLESPVLPRFHSDFSRLQRDSADCVEIAEQSQINSDEIATDSNLHTCRKRGCDAGRMGEVS